MSDTDSYKRKILSENQAEDTVMQASKVIRIAGAEEEAPKAAADDDVIHSSEPEPEITEAAREAIQEIQHLHAQFQKELDSMLQLGLTKLDEVKQEFQDGIETSRIELASSVDMVIADWLEKGKTTRSLEIKLQEVMQVIGEFHSFATCATHPPEEAA